MSVSLKICFAGNISSGKSTTLNSIFASNICEVRKNKSTYIPHIYTFDKTKEASDINAIAKNNREIFERYSKSENEEYKDIKYYINDIQNFLIFDVPLNYSYSLIEIPGLNDLKSSTHFEYLSNITNFELIDIFIYVIDINRGLNTDSDRNNLNTIVNTLKNFKNNMLIVLINKCDSLIGFDNENNPIFDDDELGDIYKEIKKYIETDYCDINKKIIPFCSSKLFAYRSLLQSQHVADETLLDEFINDNIDKSTIQGIKKKMDLINKLTGFSDLQYELCTFMAKKHKTILTNYLTNYLEKDIEPFTFSDEYMSTENIIKWDNYYKKYEQYELVDTLYDLMQKFIEKHINFCRDRIQIEKTRNLIKYMTFDDAVNRYNTYISKLNRINYVSMIHFIVFIGSMDRETSIALLHKLIDYDINLIDFSDDVEILQKLPIEFVSISELMLIKDSKEICNKLLIGTIKTFYSKDMDYNEKLDGEIKLEDNTNNFVEIVNIVKRAKFINQINLLSELIDIYVDKEGKFLNEEVTRYIITRYPISCNEIEKQYLITQFIRFEKTEKYYKVAFDEYKLLEQNISTKLKAIVSFFD